MRRSPVLVVVLLAAMTGARSAPAEAGSLLPDLDQEAPSQLEVRATGRAARSGFRLGFRSAVRNVGAGPLVIEGRRGSTRTPWMQATQLLRRDDGRPAERVGGAGRLRYVRSATHEHWHLLHFERYELRRAGAPTAAVARDRKSGFCLGDRYPAGGPLAGRRAVDPVFTGRCGLRRPDLLEVRQGMSVGHGDDYPAYVEFQDLPLDGLAAGRYVLVHRVDERRALRQLRHANDAASLLLELRWADGAPSVTVLARCPDTARCDVPAPSRRLDRAGLRLSAATTPVARPLVCVLAEARP